MEIEDNIITVSLSDSPSITNGDGIIVASEGLTGGNVHYNNHLWDQQHRLQQQQMFPSPNTSPYYPPHDTPGIGDTMESIKAEMDSVKLQLRNLEARLALMSIKEENRNMRHKRRSLKKIKESLGESK